MWFWKRKMMNPTVRTAEKIYSPSGISSLTVTAMKPHPRRHSISGLHR
jgi:hypothetical protein